MKLNVKLNGNPVVMEFNPKDLAAFVLPAEMSQKQAAAFLGCDRHTLANRRIPKNKNGKYALKTLNEWIEGEAK